jgi:hypothetical protein
MQMTYRLCDDIGIEGFSDGGLLFLASDLRTISINHEAYRTIQALLSGTSPEEIACIEANKSQANVSEILADIQSFIDQFIRHGIIYTIASENSEGTKIMSSTKFMAHPQVSYRSEPPDGGILYNPDSQTVQAVNQTGLAIWAFIAKPKTKEEICACLRRSFEEAPDSDISSDVDEFLATLKTRGFIGEVME